MIKEAGSTFTETDARRNQASAILQAVECSYFVPGYDLSCAPGKSGSYNYGSKQRNGKMTRKAIAIITGQNGEMAK